MHITINFLPKEFSLLGIYYDKGYNCDENNVETVAHRLSIGFMIISFDIIIITQ
jgi:hypothetical protein